MADPEREVDLLTNRQDAQARRIDWVESEQDKLRDEMSAVDKAVAVLMVEVGLLREAVKSNRGWTAAAALAVVGTAAGLVLFGGRP